MGRKISASVELPAFQAVHVGDEYGKAGRNTHHESTSNAHPEGVYVGLFRKAAFTAAPFCSILGSMRTSSHPAAQGLPSVSLTSAAGIPSG
ncbi:hypothetical protein ACFWOJ_28875, partial [Streptomyces sp. NPDC058439]|uniref:hypothetical protein n=1 Tax=Streptomyces sp. NPDC058439 TaxID=3346500 RepID=UPI0036677DDF